MLLYTIFILCSVYGQYNKYININPIPGGEGHQRSTFSSYFERKMSTPIAYKFNLVYLKKTEAKGWHFFGGGHFGPSKKLQKVKKKQD